MVELEILDCCCLGSSLRVDSSDSLLKVVELKILDSGSLGVESSDRGLRDARKEIGSGEVSFMSR